MHKSRPTQNKRARERARQERQKEKAQRRLEAKQRKAGERPASVGEDPDIAGIVPGPQASPWDEMGLEPWGAGEEETENEEGGEPS